MVLMSSGEMALSEKLPHALAVHHGFQGVIHASHSFASAYHKPISNANACFRMLTHTNVYERIPTYTKNTIYIYNHKYTNRYTNKSKCRCNYKSICICTNTVKNRRGYRPEGSRLWGAASARSADTVSRQETKTFPAFPAAVWRKGRESATITPSGLSTFSQEVPL